MAQKTKIRVLQGIRQGSIGGGESYLLSLVENMDRDIFEPIVVSFTDGPMVERLKQLGVRTHVVHTEKPFDVRVWKKVKQIVLDEQIDIVHAHGTRANSNMFWAALKAGKPLVYTCHAWSFHRDQHPLKKRLRILGEQFLTTKAKVNICGAVSDRNKGLQHLSQFEAVIIYNSIDPKKFNPYGSYKNLREEWGIPATDIVVTSVARMTKQKQPLALLSAFARVCREVTNVKLLMVGDGELKDEAVALIKKLGIEDRVILQPFRQDVPDVLANADIYVLPSLWEGFSIALLEAMSMGRAVIGTNVDGTAEIIQDRENGLLIGLDELENNLVEALILLCRDKNLRESLQRNAIKSIYNTYNVETLARKNEEIYKSLYHTARGKKIA